MTDFADDALVLDTIPFRERHLVVAVLTPTLGQVRGVLRGARAGKAPAAAAAQILSLVRVEGHQRPDAELATFRRVELVRSSFPLAAELDRSSAAAVVAELLASFFPAGEPAGLPFRLGRSLLDALLDAADPATVVAYAQLWTLALGGVLPPLTRCAACGDRLRGEIALEPRSGRPLCSGCAPSGARSLEPEALRFVAACEHLPVGEVERPPPRSVADWLEGLVRTEAARPLRAHDFRHRLEAES